MVKIKIKTPDELQSIKDKEANLRGLPTTTKV
jgi:hypothetical protein